MSSADGGGTKARVDDLIEPHADASTPSSYYTTEPPDWPARWPAEMLWVTTKTSR